MGSYFSGAIGELILSDGAVTSLKIQDGTIQTIDIGNGAVTTAKLAAGAVDNAKIQDASINFNKLVDGAVGFQKMAANSVGQAALVDGSVSTSKYADASITSAKLASGVALANIGAGNLASTYLAAGAVTPGKIAVGGVSATDQIADGIITAGKFAPGAVGTASVTDDSITSGKIAPTLRDVLGIDNAGSKRRGVCAIATQELIAAGSWTVMPTPDRVSGIVLPTNGVLRIGYLALWGVASGTGYAGIYLNGVQLKELVFNGAPQDQQVSTTAAFFSLLSTSHRGLRSVGSPATASTMATGPVVIGTGSGGDGGFIEVQAPAATYTVEVRFINPTNTLSVKDRRLWVEAIGF